MPDISTRIDAFIKSRNMSVRSFEMKISASNGLIGRSISKNTDIGASWLAKIMAAFPEINSEWLLTGKGDMLKKNMYIMSGNRHGRVVEPEFKYTSDLERSTVNNTVSPETDSESGLYLVPIYELSSRMELSVLLYSRVNLPTLGFLSLPDLPMCDGAVHVKSDTMYPLLRPGDIVIYETIRNFSRDIISGEMYIFSYDIQGKEYTTIKYVSRSKREGYMSIYGFGNNYEDEIEISRIRAMALVRTSVIYNTAR